MSRTVFWPCSAVRSDTPTPEGTISGQPGGSLLVVGIPLSYQQMAGPKPPFVYEQWMDIHAGLRRGPGIERAATPGDAVRVRTCT